MLQRDLVNKFPNVSVIDLRQMYTIVEDVLDKVSWVINFMAFFSILTGIIVLIGSVRTSKYQRITGKRFITHYGCPRANRS